MTPAAELDPARIRSIYDDAADRYLQSLPLEHFMESTDQSMQREITLESLALVRAIRPDFQVFSELLIQYPIPGEDPEEPARVVPDNMVVVWPIPLAPLKGFHLPEQKARPILVMEYVSQSNRRKDYDENYIKYECDLKVPYYLVFDPERQRLNVFHLEREQYFSTVANDRGRFAIPELELEVAIFEGWVRFWHRGGLLALPGELQAQLKAKDQQLQAKDQQLQAKDQQLQTKDQQLQTKDQQLQTKDQQLQTKDQQLAASQDQVRVEIEARQLAEQRASEAETELARLREEMGKAK